MKDLVKPFRHGLVNGVFVRLLILEGRFQSVKVIGLFRAGFGRCFHVLNTIQQLHIYMLAILNFTLNIVLPGEGVIYPCLYGVGIASLFFNGKFTGPPIIVYKVHGSVLPFFGFAKFVLNVCIEYIMAIGNDIGRNFKALACHAFGSVGSGIDLRFYVFNYRTGLS